jgi:hypothetical protein
MKGAKKIKDYFEDVKPLTDEELEELLDDLSNKRSRGFKPGKNSKGKKSFRKGKKEKYDKYLDF